MDEYTVKKSDGRVGYQWTCPKGFNHYNFWTEEAAWKDAKNHYFRKSKRNG